MSVLASLAPRRLAAHAAAAALVGTLCAAGVAHAASPAQQDAALAYSRCMRSHGVPNWPDPNSSGGFPVGTKQLAASSAGFPAAQSACKHLLPTNGAPSAADVQQMRAQALSFSQCIRAHGVPNFPDPDGSGRIPDPATLGINQASPVFQAANQDCARYRPPYIPSNAAYAAWARTQGS